MSPRKLVLPVTYASIKTHIVPLKLLIGNDIKMFIVGDKSCCKEFFVFILSFKKIFIVDKRMSPRKVHCSYKFLLSLLEAHFQKFLNFCYASCGDKKCHRKALVTTIRVGVNKSFVTTIVILNP